jgi:hypothetical protein
MIVEAPIMSDGSVPNFSDLELDRSVSLSSSGDFKFWFFETRIGPRKNCPIGNEWRSELPVCSQISTCSSPYRHDCEDGRHDPALAETA